ncbi:MAG: DUF2804 domain-containing protein [Dehalococcoidia bacterium]
MKNYLPRQLLPAPPSLVSGGKYNFGTFSSQFKEVNPLSADRPLGVWLPKPLLSSRLKEWQAFQLGNERWFLLAVLYSAKISALAQFIAYDRQNNKKYVFEKILPPLVIKVPASLWQARQSYQDKNSFIEIVSQLARGRFYINVKISGQATVPNIEGHFEMFHDEGLVEPIVVSIPFGTNRGMYSHKCLMPMQGSMTIGDEKTVFSRASSFAIIDDHKGFYPYRMRYDWVTAAAYSRDKQLTGFNLTDNQSIDPEKYNENCLWVDGKMSLLPAVKFSRPDGDEGTWQIKDSYGMVDLTFRPVSMGEINMDLLVLKVRYRGPFGYCDGTITDRSGRRVEIKDYFGMGEDKYLRG